MWYLLIECNENKPNVLYMCRSKDEMKKFTNALSKANANYEGELSVVTFDGERWLDACKRLLLNALYVAHLSREVPSEICRAPEGT